MEIAPENGCCHGNCLKEKWLINGSIQIVKAINKWKQLPVGRQRVKGPLQNHWNQTCFTVNVHQSRGPRGENYTMYCLQ